MIISTFNIYDSTLDQFKEYMAQEENVEKLIAVAEFCEKEGLEEKHTYVFNLLSRLKND